MGNDRRHHNQSHSRGRNDHAQYLEARTYHFVVLELRDQRGKFLGENLTDVVDDVEEAAQWDTAGDMHKDIRREDLVDYNIVRVSERVCFKLIR